MEKMIYNTAVEMHDAIRNERMITLNKLRESMGRRCVLEIRNPALLACNDQGRLESEPWFITTPYPTLKDIRQFAETVKRRHPNVSFYIETDHMFDYYESAQDKLQGADSEPTDEYVNVKLYEFTSEQGVA